MMITIPANYNLKYSPEYPSRDDLNLKDLIDNLMDHVLDRNIKDLTVVSSNLDNITFEVDIESGFTTLKKNREFIEHQIIMEFL